MFAAIKKKELAAELRPFHLFNYDYSRPSTLSGTPACRLYEKREKRKIRLDRRFSSTLAYTRQDRLNSIKNKNRKNAVVVVGKHHLAHATVWVLHSCPGSATEHIAVFFFLLLRGRRGTGCLAALHRLYRLLLPSLNGRHQLLHAGPRRRRHRRVGQVFVKLM
jgi:hypothetical protein